MHEINQQKASEYINLSFVVRLRCNWNWIFVFRNNKNRGSSRASLFISILSGLGLVGLRQVSEYCSLGYGVREVLKWIEGDSYLPWTPVDGVSRTWRTWPKDDFRDHSRAIPSYTPDRSPYCLLLNSSLHSSRPLTLGLLPLIFQVNNGDFRFRGTNRVIACICMDFCGFSCPKCKFGSWTYQCGSFIWWPQNYIRDDEMK